MCFLHQIGVLYYILDGAARRRFLNQKGFFGFIFLRPFSFTCNLRRALLFKQQTFSRLYE
jgi:hypothetical protein